MNKKNIIIVTVVVLLVIVALVWSFSSEDGVFQGSNQEVSPEAPVNIVLNFAESWLRDIQSDFGGPYEQGLADDPILSPELREKLAVAQNNSDDQEDPVLCQTTAPEQISARSIFEVEEKAQVLVTPRGSAIEKQSVFTLLREGDGWYIEDIECILPESAPPREFTFEREGFLLKSVKPPLNPEYWHLVFEEEGVLGHVAPLFFDSESRCIDLDENESTCTPGQFIEASKAFVQGELSEVGVDVKRVRFMEKK